MTTMRNILVAMSVCGALVGATRDASAQGEWADRGYVTIGFGVEKGETAFTDARNFTLYDESAKIETASSWSSGNLLDVGLGVRVWRNLSVGAAYHQENNTSDVAISGAIPHPIFFNRPRSLAVTEPGLTRKENAVHLVVGWMIPIGEKFDVLVSGGPSWFQLQQDVVSKVTVAEAGTPFTTLVTQTDRATRKRSQVGGYHVGVDATYILWSNDSVRLGAGGFFRYTAASTEVTWLTDTAQPTDVGGTQFGFGARFRF